MPSLRRALLGAVLVGAPAAALAHAGHGSASLQAGLVHPLGLDHLLAIVAVGVWSAVALPAGRRLAGPLAFMLALLAGAAAGVAGIGASLVEVGVAASVAVFGALLLAPRALPASLGLAWVAAAALLHGLAHGAELAGGASFGGFAAGFLVTTALLHGLGLAGGRAMANAHRWVWRAAAGGLGVAGIAMLAQL